MPHDQGLAAKSRQASGKARPTARKIHRSRSGLGSSRDASSTRFSHVGRARPALTGVCQDPPDTSAPAHRRKAMTLRTPGGMCSVIWSRPSGDSVAAGHIRSSIVLDLAGGRIRSGRDTSRPRVGALAKAPSPPPPCPELTIDTHPTSMNQSTGRSDFKALPGSPSIIATRGFIGCCRASGVTNDVADLRHADSALHGEPMEAPRDGPTHRGAGQGPTDNHLMPAGAS